MGWTTCSVDGSDTNANPIVNDVTSLTISTPRGIADVTGLDKSGRERLLLLADVSIGLSGTFNDAADRSHATFGNCATTSVIRTVTLTISDQNLATAAAPECYVSDYQLTRAADGSFTWTTTLENGDGAVVGWA